MTTAPTTVTALLARLAASGGRPALTWYGDDGERIELSGAVVGNWVAKTVNLLCEEFDAGPGTDVVVDLPVGWRQVVWALATARCGAALVQVDPAATADPAARHEDADVVITSRPGAWTGTSAELVAVALPALARRFDGDLPPGAVDAAAAVMTYGDAIGFDPAAGTDLPLDALIGSTDAGTAGGEAAPTGGRVLVRGDRDVAALLAEAVGVWSRGGSVVLVSARTTAELDADAERLGRLVATEQVTGV
ncbi:TIGR03089 family protein [Isoptericola aurantiacus]|uniref:TIGR03089 family protein n=1 Tax=Isoptericola aurantiacus TaxID=3377839 RepID=UPI00383B69A9